MNTDTQRADVHALADNLLELVARGEAPQLSAEWMLRLAAEVSALKQERDFLFNELNTPHTADFLRAAQAEAGHQRLRWGVDHDAGKRAEDWTTLVVYLLGKAAHAHFNGDTAKLLHHIVTLAAVCANWHAHATGADTRMRPGLAPRPEGAS